MIKKIYAWTAQTTTWTVPSDWNNNDNIIEIIGRGGSSSANALGGGGGGAYAEILNVSLTPGSTVYLGTTDTGITGVWFNKTSNAKPTSTTDGVFAADGKNATTATGGAGGLNTDSIGTNTFSGGNGGNGNATLVTGGGGGGAGGPNGAGKNGGSGDATAAGDDGGGGGGGAGGGTSTAGGAGGASGGAGGNGPNGSGGGTAGSTSAGGSGSDGGGGGGGDQAQPGGSGGSGGDIGVVTDVSTNGIAAGTVLGAGGGEGGDGGLYATTSASTPGNYGGGAGGGATTTAGADGVIIISYTVAEIPGARWVWGANDQGQLGVNDRTNRSVPTQVSNDGTNWLELSAGSRFMAGIRSDGTLWLWGNNAYGQLGNNDNGNVQPNSNVGLKSSPVQTVSGGTDWKTVECGIDFTAAIKTDGSLWLWGSNSLGQLGDNSSTPKSSPVQTVSGGTNWRSVACGWSHVAAIKTDGTLWLWGAGTNGQLGNNAATSRSSPVQTVSGGINWFTVAAGQNITTAIKTNGTLWTWGSNNAGALGDNTTVNKSSPVQTVATGTNWKMLACDAYNIAALKTDNTLWVWGGNESGSLGTNDSANKSSPVQTVSGGTDWYSIYSGGYHIASIKTDGTLWSWGINFVGKLGLGNDFIPRSSPVQTSAGGTNWVCIASDLDTNAGAVAAIRSVLTATGNMFMLF